MNSKSSDPSGPISKRAARWLIANRLWLLALGAALAIASVWLTPPVQYDRSIERMFADSDPVRLAYERLTRRFAANEVVLAVYTDAELLSPSGVGFRRLDRIDDRLRAAPGVREVLSLTEVNRALEAIDLGGLVSDSEVPALLRDKPLAQELLSLFEGMTHGSGGQTVGIACLLEPRADASVDRQTTVQALRQVMRDLPPGATNGMITGEPVMVADGFRFVEQDGRRLARVSIVLTALCIALLFRSIRWMLIPLAVVQLSILLCRSFLAINQAKLTLVSSMTAAILTVIAVAAVVHVIVAVRRGMAGGLKRHAALQRAFERLLAPIFWSAVTDAVGFGSLMISAVGPVRDYGWIMAVGSLLVLPSLWLLTPGLALLGNWDRAPHRAWGEDHLDDSLALSSRLISKYPKRFMLAFALVGAICCIGATRLQLETDFTRSFRQDNPLVEAYGFVEERLGGAGVWDVSLPAPPTLNADYLKRVEALESELRALQIDGEPGFTKVISVADAVQAASASPALRWTPAPLRVRGMRATMPVFFETLMTTDESEDAAERGPWIRVMLRSRERQTAEHKQLLIAKTRDIVAKHFPGEVAGNEERRAGERRAGEVAGNEKRRAGEVAGNEERRAGERRAGEVAGFFVLLSELVQSTIQDQWRCFAASILAMGLTLSIALRSLRLALLALLTNATPVAAVLGLVGWTGIKVNLGVAMIAAVSLGLSVDSSLHFLFDYRRRRAAGDSLDEALAHVQQNVGRAMLFATCSLVAGFLVLTTSPFVPTITFGWLAALAMVGGVIGNLTVLPLLLKLTEPRTPSAHANFTQP